MVLPLMAARFVAKRAVPAAIAGAKTGIANVAIEEGYQRIVKGRVPTEEMRVRAFALGAIPGIGLAKLLPKGAGTFALGKEFVTTPRYVGKTTDYAVTLYHYGHRDAGRIVAGVTSGFVINRLITEHYSEKKSRAVRSLTSRTENPRQPTKILARSAPKARSKTSRRTVLTRKSGRKTSYCKVHRKYDFCEKYNIRK